MFPVKSPTVGLICARAIFDNLSLTLEDLRVKTASPQTSTKVCELPDQLPVPAKTTPRVRARIFISSQRLQFST